MTLPVLNSTPSYTTTIPSTGKEVRFRPFLVQEQKILLIALESEDMKNIVRAINDMLSLCYEDVDIKSLSTFDVDYLFLQIRGKSVGEKIEAQMSCTECKTQNDIEVNIDDINMTLSTDDTKKIELTPEWTLVMKYPTYDNIINSVASVKTETELLYEMIIASFDQIKSDASIIEFRDSTKEELEKFLGSMTPAQFEKVSSFVNNIPKLQHVVKFNCKKCETKNEHILEGMSDFFL
jgi:hypothetical protein